jgi:hypothetical protein
MPKVFSLVYWDVRLVFIPWEDIGRETLCQEEYYIIFNNKKDAALTFRNLFSLLIDVFLFAYIEWFQHVSNPSDKTLRTVLKEIDRNIHLLVNLHRQFELYHVRQL